MRILLLAGAALLFPASLNAQAVPQPAPQSADQVNAQTQPVPRTTTVTTTPSTTVVTTTNPGNLTPPPAQALNKTYPVCTRALQDNCQNAGEGGAPGRSRALSYWPGEPASARRTDSGG